MKRHSDIITFILDMAIIFLVLLVICAMGGLVSGQIGLLKASVIALLCKRGIVDIGKYERHILRKAKAIRLASGMGKSASAA